MRKLTGVSFRMGSGDMSGRKPTGSTLLFLKGDTDTGGGPAAPKGEAGAEVEALKGLSALTGVLPKGLTEAA